jgi:NADH-quinone oxidoreductase subunit E
MIGSRRKRGGRVEQGADRMIAHKKLDFKNLHYTGQEGKLIPELQKVQERDGYISEERIKEIHQHSGIPLSQIYGVATFYSQFRLHPVGKHIVRVCHGTACHVSGAKGITDALVDQFKINVGETTEDKMYTLEVVSCIGCCSLAPVIMIDHSTFGNLVPNDIKKIITQYKKSMEEVANK